MTVKRYKDGTIAKWYYSRPFSRVITDGDTEYCLSIKDSNKDYFGVNKLLDKLNDLEDKIISLEKENKKLKRRLE